MSEVAHNETREFWRPPVVAAVTSSNSLPDVCSDCGSEYMVGAAFCHSCGRSRDAEGSLQSGHWFKVLEFQNIKQRLQLTTASLVAFIAGLGCMVGAISVGWVYSAQTLSDFQAIQLWRIEWLLGAAAAFLAGILLKRETRNR